MRDGTRAKEEESEKIMTYSGGVGGRPFTYEVIEEILTNHTIATPDTLSLVSGLPTELVYAILREMEEQNEVEVADSLFGDESYVLRNR